MSKRLEGKIALVTGAGSGIGRATAIAFAAEGARVVGICRTVEKGNETVKYIQKAGGAAMFVPADVSDTTQLKSLFDTIRDRFGRLDCAANIAGTEGEAISLFDMDEASWDSVLDTNLKGTLFLMKHEAMLMKATGGGAIVNTASILAFRGYPGHYAYCASKHGILGLTRTAAIELGPYNIRVNTVIPGFIKTGMSDRFIDSEDGQAFVQSFNARVPLGRVGQPEDCAGLYVSLCSDETKYVTGIYVAADGGFMATL
jgi:NAD(P)-dependent dehydrogenase (short-subunit alcohol dehydrogenase family)